MKVIFMGTPDFAVSIVDEIYRAGHEIVLIVTQPDKAKGRSGKLTPSDVGAWAVEHNIETYKPTRIREASCIEYLKKYEADIGVVAAFGQILPQEILDLPKYGCINVHASLLPKYRGAAPIQWAILNGESKTGVSIMQMGPGLDDGDVIYTEETAIKDDETGGMLFDRLAQIGATACVKAMGLIDDYCTQNNRNRIAATPQNDEDATHVGMIKKSLGNIDFEKPAEEICRYVRGLNPWPSAYTYYNGKTLKIWDADVVNSDAYTTDATPGEIVDVTRDAVIVATGVGALRIKELQLEGKRRMNCEDFLKGRSMNVGEVLCSKPAE